MGIVTFIPTVSSIFGELGLTLVSVNVLWGLSSEECIFLPLRGRLIIFAGGSVHGIFQARVLEWLPFPCSGDVPDPGIEPRSPALQADALQKNSPTNARVVGWSLVQEDSLQKEMVTHASILAWEIPGTVAGQAPLSTDSQKTRLRD